jgi:hypothetical protein
VVRAGGRYHHHGALQPAHRLYCTSAWKNLTNQHPALRSLRAIAQEIQGHVPENIVGS